MRGKGKRRLTSDKKPRFFASGQAMTRLWRTALSRHVLFFSLQTRELVLTMSALRLRTHSIAYKGVEEEEGEGGRER